MLCKTPLRSYTGKQQQNEVFEYAHDSPEGKVWFGLAQDCVIDNIVCLLKIRVYFVRNVYVP